MSNSNKRKTLIEKSVVTDGEWFAKFEALTEGQSHYMLLESGRTGRYSIMGLQPEAIIKGKDKMLSVKTSNGKEHVHEGDLLQSLEEVLKPYSVDKMADACGPPIQGGALGYISYDVVRQIEKLADQAQDDLLFPEIYFLVFEDLFVYDHEEHLLWICVNGSSEVDLLKRVQAYKEQWKYADKDSKDEQANREHKSIDGVKTTFSEDEFGQAVRTIKDYIRAGDVFQVNLSVRHSRPLQAEPIEVYKQLRSFNPSPYMSYMHTPEHQIVSASPELLVKKRGTELSTRPIAGTRSRGKTPAEDAELEHELTTDEKERAEHVMLVDLERNDLGRVSSYGSVEVDELLVVEKYSHVMHLVSNVKGQLAKGLSLFDCIRATFPGGTITGAPKVRTMEIIEELEPVRRGIYTGAIGWISFHGDMELNIVIRTMVCQDGQAYVQAGAGIVIDSNPVQEYKESIKKARALWHAYELAEKSYEMS
ncbi:para-aminobenzoate synthase, aminase component [Bacillus sp. JCM 19045]|nr:para-aminobenzoate synthase, aminase component [Bacillus sp. JCM 19045]